ncbi:glycosyltransferase [Dinghuibacter silviterrae]|uniref:Glycosyltransferase involved in cell wall biosynthesis n=1 Tax=Dinghuibacter silviterrae TaxID=1539049 RepID=A0A4R8DPM8_9BACT|nr:glycosyltransferase [Dinghuibacter silviterrae]TDX00042.1 glycosyltransferase involved in cell wall biosynthesis [Dinghuibacter silviterrae]
MNKIRILQCIETIGSGGVEQLRYNLCKGIDKDRFELKIICTQTLGVLPGRMRETGVEIIPVGKLKTPFHWSRYKAVLRVVRSYKPHIIHGAVFEGCSMAVVASRFSRIPAVIIEETSDPIDRTWRGNTLMRLYAGYADRIVAVSETAGSYIRKVVGVKEPKLKVIDNGVSIPEVPDPEAVKKLRGRLGIAEGDFVIGSVGRLFDEVKKVSVIIKATALLIKRGIPLKLLIVGDGSDQDMLEALCDTLGIRASVIFAGYQGDTAPYYACMDLFVLASQHESFGMVLVEAMYLHLPVVATAVGGIPYVVEDGKTGLLVPKNDPPAMAVAIETLYRDPAGRKAFGQAGWERAMGNFTSDIYVEKVQRLYLELAEEKGLSS